MINDWKHAYVYGDVVLLREWLCKQFPDGDGGYSAGDIAFVGPYLLPRRKTGTKVDEFGVSAGVYALLKGRTDAVCLISVRGKGIAALKKAESLEFCFAVHRGASVKEIAALYPSHTLGTSVPYVCD